MASDITLAVGDGSRRMSYAALAEARGISVLAARQLTRRHRWHKQVGNDGFVVVSVPLSALENPQKSAKSADAASRHSINAADTASAATDAASDTASDTVSDTASDAASSEIAIRAVEALREQLDRAEADKTELRQQLGRERGYRNLNFSRSCALRSLFWGSLDARICARGTSPETTRPAWEAGRMSGTSRGNWVCGNPSFLGQQNCSKRKTPGFSQQ